MGILTTGDLDLSGLEEEGEEVLVLDLVILSVRSKLLVMAAGDDDLELIMEIQLLVYDGEPCLSEFLIGFEFSDWLALGAFLRLRGVFMLSDEDFDA